MPAPRRRALGAAALLLLPAPIGCSIVDGTSPEEQRLFVENEKLKVEVQALTTDKERLEAELADLESGETPAFLAALRSKRAGDCAAALARFDDFLIRYPASDLAPIAEQEAFECRVKAAEAASAAREQMEAFFGTVEAMPALADRVKALRDWLDANRSSPQAGEVRARIESLEKMIQVEQRYLKPP